LVTDVEAHDSTVGDERARRVPDSQSDPHATRQDHPSAPPSGTASGTNHGSPSDPDASLLSPFENEEDPAFAATNAAVLAPTPDPGAPQSSIQPSDAAQRGATGEDSAPV